VTSSLPNEYTEVELPLLRQLVSMGWSHVEGSKWEPSASDRETFREVVLSGHLRAALRRINVDESGNEWLDESRVAQAEAALLRSSALKLLEANLEVTTILLTGTTVDGIEGRDGGRGQTVHYIDWIHPERNEFLAINQFRVDEPGGQAHKYVVPDIVLFVNGIPLVVIECKSPYISDPAIEAIDQLQRYANQRARTLDNEGNEHLFHSNQFVVATYFDKAMGPLHRKASTSPSGRRQSHFRAMKWQRDWARRSMNCRARRSSSQACSGLRTCWTSSATSRFICRLMAGRSR